MNTMLSAFEPASVSEMDLHYENSGVGEQYDAQPDELVMTAPDGRDERDLPADPHEDLFEEDPALSAGAQSAGELAVSETVEDPHLDAGGGSGNGPTDLPPPPGDEVPDGEGNEDGEPPEPRKEATDLPNETAERPETIPQAKIDAVIDVTGTTPTRLLMAAVVASDPTREWTAWAIRKEINRLLIGGATEPSPEVTDLWLGPNASSMLKSYNDSFTDKELMEERLNDKGHRIVAANPAAADITLAVTGAIIGWQADHPDLPFQRIAGTQYQGAALDSERRISSLRLAIAGVANETTYGDIAGALGEYRIRVESTVRDMVAGGILEISSALRPEVRAQTPVSVRVHPAWKQAIDGLTQRLAALRYATPEELTAACDRTRAFLDDPGTVQLMLRFARQQRST